MKIIEYRTWVLGSWDSTQCRSMILGYIGGESTCFCSVFSLLKISLSFSSEFGSLTNEISELS